MNLMVLGLGFTAEGWESRNLGCIEKTTGLAKLLFAPHEAFELVPKPNLHSTYALSQQTLNPKP